MIKNSDETAAMDAIRRITWLGAISNLFLVGFKFAAGIWGHSSVIIADAVHSLSDLITDAALLLGIRFWSRPADQDHPYGHAKIESLVTLFIGTVLATAGMGLLYDAVHSLIGILNKTAGRVPPTLLPLAAALVSIAVKEWLYRITVKVGMAAKSTATVANAWHHRSDALSSIPAAAAIGACLLLGPQYTFLDPVGTVVVAFMLIYTAWKVTQPTFAALLDSGASELQCQVITEVIRSFAEVKKLHKLRTRYIGPAGLALDVHIHVDPNMSVTDAHTLSHRIQHKLLQSGGNIIDVFVHVEPESEILTFAQEPQV
jgi:cation diffusion facilitator family transporter